MQVFCIPQLLQQLPYIWLGLWGWDTSGVTFTTDASVPCGEGQRWCCLSVCSGGFTDASEDTALSMHFSLVVVCDLLVNTCLNIFLFKLLLCL